MSASVMALQIALGLGMVVLAVSVLFMRNLMASAVALAGFSLLLALEFYVLQAPDVAIAEAGIGAGLTTAIFMVAIRAVSAKGKKAVAADLGGAASSRAPEVPEQQPQPVDKPVAEEARQDAAPPEAEAVAKATQPEIPESPVPEVPDVPETPEPPAPVPPEKEAP
jgi:uncharacterized MnhB-related membrane protein